MKYIILAAGQGTRLRPLTDNIPKSMVQYQSAPLIESHLKIASRFNLNDLVVVTGYAKEAFADIFERFSVKEVVNENYASTNMIYSLYCARKEMEGELVIAYSDILYDDKILGQLISSKKDISIASDKNWYEYWSHRLENPLDDAETFKVDDSNNILELGSKPKTSEEVGGQFIGLLYFSEKGSKVLCDFMDDIVENKKTVNGKPFENAYMTDLLQEMINKDIKINASFFDHPWIEIDSLEDHGLEENRKRFVQIMEE